MKVLLAWLVAGVGCAHVARLDPGRDRPPAAPVRDPQGPSLGVTGGAGGPMGDWSGRHALGDQEGGYVVHVPTLGGDPPRYGVVVLLHADDGTPPDPTREPALRGLAARRGLILVAVRSPGPVDSGCWWSPHKQRRADYLVDLLQTEIFPKYDVDLGRVHLAGKSGGAFWGAGVPFYRDLGFRGGVVGVCGGDVPREDSDVDWCAFTETEDDPPAALDARHAEVIGDWRLYLAHTARDPWVSNYDDTAALWTGLGAPVAHVVTGNGRHCALDDVGWLVQGIDWVDAP